MDAISASAFKNKQVELYPWNGYNQDITYVVFSSSAISSLSPKAQNYFAMTECT